MLTHFKNFYTRVPLGFKNSLNGVKNYVNTLFGESEIKSVMTYFEKNAKNGLNSIKNYVNDIKKYVNTVSMQKYVKTPL